jgi:hypothetical protein
MPDPGATTRAALAAFAGALLCVPVHTADAAPGQVHLSWKGSPATTMVVTWRSTASTGEVELGTTASYGSKTTATSTAYNGSHLHHAELTGLKPGTLYHYRCGKAGGWSPDRTFRTAPPAGTTFRYAVFGDNRSDDVTRAKVMNAIKQRDPLFSLHTGDYVSDGKVQSQWNTWFATMQPLLAVSPMMGALGNHENLSPSYFNQLVFPTHSPKVSGVQDEAYYAFDVANTHFVALSTEHSPTKDDPQYKWLRQDLIDAAKDPKIKWVVAFAHRPPYSSGASHGDNPAIQKAWNHLFETFGVDVTYWGHDHTYERHKPLFGGSPVAQGSGVIYIVTGGAGAPLYTVSGSPRSAVCKKLYHFVEVNVSGDQMKLSAREPDGKVFDTLTLTKSGPKPTWIMDAAPDAGAKVISSKAAGELRSLSAAYDGRYLYVATQGAPAKLDHFILLSASKPAGQAAAPWAKAGKTWPAHSMLAMESSSAWCSWQRSSGSMMIPMGATWKYHDKGQDLGTTWMTTSFSDATWPSGPAELGYGDNDEATKLVNASPNHPSAYFRRTFTLAGPVSSAQLKVLYDDGVAVWLNGVQVLAQNMGNGTSYSAWASQQSSDDAIVTKTISGPFKVGQNLLAAMVKQVNGSSSDLSFDLSLAEGGGDILGARATNPAGQLMEGLVDLKQRFGSVPQRVYLAAAAYGTADGGALTEQLPTGNGDGNLDVGEWVELVISQPAQDGGPHGDGAPATDGPKSGDGHASGDGAQPGPDAGGGPAEDEGCGCEVGRRQPTAVVAPLWLLLLAGIAGGWLRRRKRRR